MFLCPPRSGLAGKEKTHQDRGETTMCVANHVSRKTDGETVSSIN